MPSPAGHSLIGLAIGAAWLLPRGPAPEILRAAWRARGPLLGCVALANLPDLDYLPGMLAGELNRCHHFYTHTPGWCALVALGAWCLLRARRGPVPPRPAVLGWLLLLLGSHLLADFVTEDKRPPIGIMALWPLTTDVHLSPVTFFEHLRKRTYAEFLQWHNAHAVMVEIAWTLPVLLGVVLWKRPRRTPAQDSGLPPPPER